MWKSAYGIRPKGQSRQWQSDSTKEELKLLVARDQGWRKAIIGKRGTVEIAMGLNNGLE